MTQSMAHLKTNMVVFFLLPSNPAVSATKSVPRYLGAEPLNALGPCVPMVLRCSVPFDFRFRRTLILHTKHWRLQGGPKSGWRRENRAQEWALQCLGRANAPVSRALMHQLIFACGGLDSGPGSFQAGCWWKLLVKHPSVSGEAIKLGKWLGEMAKETCEQEFLLVVFKAAASQAEMKWLLSQKSRRYLQTWDYVQTSPSWQPDPGGKSSENCNTSSYGSTWEFQFSGLPLCSACKNWTLDLKQASNTCS